MGGVFCPENLLPSALFGVGIFPHQEVKLHLWIADGNAAIRRERFKLFAARADPLRQPKATARTGNRGADFVDAGIKAAFPVQPGRHALRDMQWNAPRDKPADHILRIKGGHQNPHMLPPGWPAACICF